VAAQFGQAAAAGGPDAAGRDAESGADLGVGQRRVLHEQGGQVVTGRRQIGERLAQRRVPLRGEQLIVGQDGLLVGDVLGVQRTAGRGGPAGLADDPGAFAGGGGGQPAGQGGRVADLADVPAGVCGPGTR
jgi:hypothetical protein